MTPKSEPTLDQILKALQAKRAAEATRTNPTPDPKQKTGGKQCHIHAIRHQLTGQFYALSKEDRTAFDQHCTGITDDLKPESNRERWLATSIAEDQWRLNRARALENNIFAIGMFRRSHL
jgi:hypothetical protein